MKVEISYAACKGHGRCEKFAPEVFKLDKHQLPDVLQVYPDEALHQKVVRAGNACPARAVLVETWVKAPLSKKASG